MEEPSAPIGVQCSNCRPTLRVADQHLQNGDLRNGNAGQPAKYGLGTNLGTEVTVSRDI